MKSILTLITALLLAPLAALHAGEPSLMKPCEHKHLMVDSRIVCNVQNAKLVLGLPVKAPENPLFRADKPWENALNNLYPNVLWEEHEHVFKLWYKCVLADKDVIAKMDGPSTVHDVGWYLLYATSQDGLRWTKPALGLLKHEGSDANNIVARDCPNVGVFEDLHDAEAGRRYKMVSDVGLGKPQVRFSPDGIHLGPAIEAMGFGPQNGDTHNNALWDDGSGKYVWFTKLYLGERTMARFESDDFIHWKNNGMVLRSTFNEGRDSQTYCMTPFRYGNQWLAYVMIYHPGKGRSVDCELAWSPDALHWERVKPGTPFISRGAKGAYDSECIYAMAGPPIVQDGQLLIYYGGDDFPHLGWKRSCLPCLARLPVDRFAGYAAVEKERPATLMTAQLIVTEEPMCISADAAGGSVRITAIDDTAVVIDETEPVTGTVTDFAVKWKNKGLSKHIGRRVQLRIAMNNATLWSIAGIELAERSPRPPTNPLNDPAREISPLSRRCISFDKDAQGWKAVDEITYHSTGESDGGYVSIARDGGSPPIARSPATEKESPLAGDWPHVFGGNGATITCQARAAKEGGKLQIELFAGDLANWSFQSDTTFGSEWKRISATLRYGWSDEEATAAGWRRAANSFSWSETIQHVGRVVILPAAAGAPGRFDLDEIAVSGEP